MMRPNVLARYEDLLAGRLASILRLSEGLGRGVLASRSEVQRAAVVAIRTNVESLREDLNALKGAFGCPQSPSTR